MSGVEGEATQRKGAASAAEHLPSHLSAHVQVAGKPVVDCCADETVAVVYISGPVFVRIGYHSHREEGLRQIQTGVRNHLIFESTGKAVRLLTHSIHDAVKVTTRRLLSKCTAVLPEVRLGKSCNTTYLYRQSGERRSAIGLRL
jgi:hypothetical protein